MKLNKLKLKLNHMYLMLNWLLLESSVYYIIESPNGSK